MELEAKRHPESRDGTTSPNLALGSAARRGYDMFLKKEDGCVEVVLKP